MSDVRYFTAEELRAGKSARMLSGQTYGMGAVVKVKDGVRKPNWCQFEFQHADAKGAKHTLNVIDIVQSAEEQGKAVKDEATGKIGFDVSNFQAAVTDGVLQIG